MTKNNDNMIKNILLAGIISMTVSTAVASPEPGCFKAQSEMRNDDKAEVVKYLLVWDKAGGFVSFPLQERPRIVTDVEQQVIKCITSSEEVSFSLTDVHKYTLDANGEDTAVDNITSGEGTFTRDAGTLQFENYKAGSAVSIYTLDGMAVATYKVDNEGCLTVSTAEWSSGVYIIKTESVTYKVIKK